MSGLYSDWRNQGCIGSENLLFGESENVEDGGTVRQRTGQKLLFSIEEQTLRVVDDLPRLHPHYGVELRLEHDAVELYHFPGHVLTSLSNRGFPLSGD